MQYGFVMPHGDAADAVELASEAEAAGWDAFFVWEPSWGVDAWVTLAAVAMRTSRIRLGTMLTPPSRMRPWKLASETATLDRLSGGRVVLAVGLGAPDTFQMFGEVTDRRERAELLDEGLAIIERLWADERFVHEGKHYRVDLREGPHPPTITPPLVQQPRIPIWVVGAWGRPKSMRRVLRYDGLIPQVYDAAGDYREITSDDVSAMRTYLDERSPGRRLDIVVEGTTPADDATAARGQVQPMADAGATWWVESMWSEPNTRDDLLARLRAGPPR